MELNWTTFILEMVNFLVLVWILKRFLYQPVLRVIEARKSRIQASLDQAQQSQQQADQLRSQFENRLAEWQEEKQTAREAFQRDTELQRKQALQALQVSLADTLEKARVVEERRLREVEEHKEREALELGARFAARLLQGLAGPELEARILNLLSDQLAALTEEEFAPLLRAVQTNHRIIQVASAYPLNERQRQTLEQVLRQSLGADISCNFHEESGLIAGLRLSLGDWVMEANLRDELRAFLDTAREID